MLITNGLLLNRYWIDCLSELRKLSKIKISLDGAHSEVNDAIRGNGVFDKVDEKIKLVKNLSDLEVIVMFTLMRSNIKDVKDLYLYYKNMNANGFIVERFIPIGRGSACYDEVLSKDEWENTVEHLFKSKNYAFNSENSMHFKAFWINLNGAEPDIRGAFCTVNHGALCIMPDGKIYPCRRLPVNIGNLRQESFESVLTRMKHLKNISNREEDLFPGCRALTYAMKNIF